MNERIHTEYSAEDIQNYLSGSLTPLQMNAMEKAALDDPFLAEAMEGYSGMQQQDWNKQFAELKNSFAQQQEAKVISISKNKNAWQRAAAAILAIALCSSIGYYFLNKKPETEIAAVKTETNAVVNDTVKIAAADTKQIPEASDTETANPVIAQNTTPKQNTTIVKDLTRNNYEATAIAADSNFVYKPVTAKNESKSKQGDDAKAVEELKEVVTQNTAAAPAAENNTVAANNSANTNVGYSTRKSSAAPQNIFDKNTEQDLLKKEQPLVLNKTFNALVVGADNSPLPFANVSIKSENFGTYADVKGSFRLLSNDSVLTVEVKSAGFKPQLYNLKSTVSLNKIVLTEDNSAFANTTVITAGGVKNKASRRATLIKDSIVNVEPADGWNNYYTYANNNFEIPDDILEKNIHGKVELSFDVNNQGVISNIKIDKSLCNGCDEAAVRLLQQGPQWKVKKGKKGKGKITVQF